MQNFILQRTSCIVFSVQLIEVGMQKAEVLKFHPAGLPFQVVLLKLLKLKFKISRQDLA